MYYNSSTVSSFNKIQHTSGDQKKGRVKFLQSNNILRFQRSTNCRSLNELLTRQKLRTGLRRWHVGRATRRGLGRSIAGSSSSSISDITTGEYRRCRLEVRKTLMVFNVPVFVWYSKLYLSAFTDNNVVLWTLRHLGDGCKIGRKRASKWVVGAATSKCPGFVTAANVKLLHRRHVRRRLDCGNRRVDVRHNTSRFATSIRYEDLICGTTGLPDWNVVSTWEPCRVAHQKWRRGISTTRDILKGSIFFQNS